MPLHKEIKLPDPEKKVEVSEQELFILRNQLQPLAGKGRGKEIVPVEGEVWKEFKKGYYVSDLGRVKKDFTYATGEKVQIQMNGRGKEGSNVLEGHGFRNRIVYAAFHPEEDITDKYILHIDCNKTNCRADNLKAVESVKECFKHAKLCGKAPVFTKTQDYIAKDGTKKKKKVAFTDKDLNQIRKYYKAGVSMGKIAELIGCSRTYVDLIIKNKHRPEKKK